jgi:hypothetical protein
VTVSSTFIVGSTVLRVYGLHRDGKLKRAVKVIIDGKHTTIVDTAGRLHSTRIGRSFYYGKRWTGHLALVREAIKLGIVPRTNLVRVAELEKQRRERHYAALAAQDTLRRAEQAGVRLPAETVQALKRKTRALRRAEP